MRRRTSCLHQLQDLRMVDKTHVNVTKHNSMASNTTKTSKTIKPNKTMKQEIKAAVAKQTVKKLAAKAEQVMVQKAITKAEKKVVPNVPRTENKSILQKLAGVAGKAWNWLQEGGWETLLTIGTLVATTGPENKNKFTMHLVGNETISAGDVLAKIPIAADMFDDVNDRLQRQLSLYTYYAFKNSSIHFKGAQGDLVNGQIGMFIVPDPDLIIATDDSAAIVRLIREYGGRIMKLNDSGFVRIPEADRLLAVQPGMTDERRTFVQGTLYIVAVTDLNFDGPLGEFAIQYTIEMSKAANTGLVSLPDPVLKFMNFNSYSFPNSTPPTQDQYIHQYEQSYADFIQPQYLNVKSSNFSTTVGEYLQFPPGIYRIQTNAQAGFTTNGPAASGLEYFQAYQMTLCCSDTPVWNAQNDPTNTNYWVEGSVPITMTRSASGITGASIVCPELCVIRTQPFFIGYNCGIQQNGGDISSTDTLVFDVYFTVVQIQEFPIQGFNYSLETMASSSGQVRERKTYTYSATKKDKENKNGSNPKESNTALPSSRRSSVSPQKL